MFLAGLFLALHQLQFIKSDSASSGLRFHQSLAPYAKEMFTPAQQPAQATKTMQFSVLLGSQLSSKFKKIGCTCNFLIAAWPQHFIQNPAEKLQCAACVCLSVQMCVSLHPYDFQDPPATFRPAWREKNLADARFYGAGQLERAI